MQINHRTIFIILLVAINVALDQVSKEIARTTLEYNEVIFVLGDYFILTKVENPGAMLSVGESLPDFFRKILLAWLPALVLIVAMVYVILKRRIRGIMLAGYCIVIGGGIGNVIDRIRFGTVTDFMNMGIGELRTGIFNIADVSIMIGVGLIIIGIIRNKPKNQAPVSNS